MKTILYILLSLLLAGFLFFLYSWQSKVGRVRRYLGERYEEAFAMKYSLLDHWSTIYNNLFNLMDFSPEGSRNYESIIAYPKADIDIRFTVSIASGVFFSDDYLDLLIGKQYEEEFKRKLFAPDDRFRLLCSLNDLSWRFQTEEVKAVPKTLPELMALCQERPELCEERPPALQVAVVLLTSGNSSMEAFKERCEVLLEEWRRKGWDMVIICFFVDESQLEQAVAWERESFFTAVYRGFSSLCDYPRTILSTADGANEPSDDDLA